MDGCGEMAEVWRGVESVEVADDVGVKDSEDISELACDTDELR